MKTNSIIALFFIISLFSLSACSKKSDDSVTPGGSSQSTAAGFQAKIDGKTYAPDFSYALAAFPGANGYYAIYGLNSQTSDIVAIALPNTDGVGTFTLSNVDFAAVTINKADFSTVNGGTGTITITKKTDSNIVGTFSFTAYDATGTQKITITDGAFNVAVR